MKHNVFLLLGVLCDLFSLPLSAQTEKGNFVISGRSSFDFAYVSNRVKGENVTLDERYALDVDSYTLKITPSFGFFVIDNLALGGEVSYSFSDGDYQNKSTQFVIMPTATYYIPIGKVVRPLVTAGAGYANISQEVSINSSSSATKSFNGFTWGAGLGAAFFVHHNISIDLLAQYIEIYANYSDDSSVKFSTKGLGGSIGLSVYF